MSGVGDTAIVGGGLAGLAVAALLAHTGARVALFEAGALGGKLGRHRVGGGASSLQSNRPAVYPHGRPWAPGADDDTGSAFTSGPTLFTFPEVWEELCRALGERDPLALVPRPGGLGRHHTPWGSFHLSEHPEFEAYARPLRPLREPLVTLLTTPPRLGAPRFALASARLGRGLFPHASAAGYLRARVRDRALRHALAVHALNAGLPPGDAPALYALLPALLEGGGVLVPAGGMGRVVEVLRGWAEARGAALHPHTPVTGLTRDGNGWALSVGGERQRFARVICAASPAVLARLRGHPYRPRRLSTSGLALYFAHDASGLPPTQVFTPDRYAAYRAAAHAGALPPSTLLLAHAEGDLLSALLAVPAGIDLTPEHPWVRGQLARLEAQLGQPLPPPLLALTPAHYARLGSPGGALYGAAHPLWRAGPLHPHPHRLGGGLWQVGGETHPGGGIPAVLGGALMLASELGIR